MKLPKLQEPHYSSGGAGGVTVYLDEQVAARVNWQAVRQRLAELAFVPTGLMGVDNLRRLEWGLPIVKRGRW